MRNFWVRFRTFTLLTRIWWYKNSVVFSLQWFQYRDSVACGLIPVTHHFHLNSGQPVGLVVSKGDCLFVFFLSDVQRLKLYRSYRYKKNEVLYQKRYKRLVVETICWRKERRRGSGNSWSRKYRQTRCRRTD